MIVLGMAGVRGRLSAQGTIVTDSVSSPGLASNVVGDSPVRRTLVHLPPSYQRDSTRRYPVRLVRYADTTFAGGHVDRVRERFTQHMLPTVGKWFAER